jgi:hypothetical protein
LTAAEALAVLGREHGMSHWRAQGERVAAWARGRLYNPAANASKLRGALEDFTDHGTSVGLLFYEALLAELEAETLGPAIALKSIDNALALSNHVQYRSALSFMHRIRGDILLKLDPANPAPPEDAYRMAIAIANEQSARSPNLQAALALAKLYQSTARPAESQAILAPALEGFSPTPELPEIAEARALLESLAHGGEGAMASKDQAT